MAKTLGKNFNKLFVGQILIINAVVRFFKNFFNTLRYSVYEKVQHSNERRVYCTVFVIIRTL